jgi:hypothetical protein
MTRYLHLLAVTIVLSWATTASSAVECKAELPSARTGYWSWRIIDGKQCWYPGRPGMSKAELQWPRSVRQPARKEADFVQPKNERGFVQPQGDELPFAERWPY